MIRNIKDTLYYWFLKAYILLRYGRIKSREIDGAMEKFLNELTDYTIPDEMD